LRRRVAGAHDEFRSLRCDDALQRLHAGIRWFSANGWPLTGFAAPRWNIGPGAWAALQLTPFLYALTRHGVHVLSRDEELGSHSIEVCTQGLLGRSASLAWHALPGRLGQDASPLVRLELTPDAAEHRAVKLAWQRALHHHLSYRQPHTVARVVQAWQPALPRSGSWAAGMHKPSSARV
jgi:predicted deacetylase